MAGAATHPDHGSTATTNGIVISVEPAFMPQHSDPDAERYIFSYTIRIANESDRPVTLLSRHWVVLDANAKRHDVEGEGVIGRQPQIRPGASFEYSSWCPLATPWGTMEGRYRFATEAGEEFDAAIARFYLVCEDG